MSSAGRCIACSTESGIVVGPGMARNSRPARTVIAVLPCAVIRRNLHTARERARCFYAGKPCKKRCLPSGLPAAGGFGLLDRAEPARALGYLHLDLGVPAAG